ncbi:MAG: hypothetical protein GY765_05875, partial [bacterium]|nr:hypothetical protein [bacterium]
MRLFRNLQHVNIFLILCLFIVAAALPLAAQDYIADYGKSKESVLRSIPEWALDAAKNNLHILYTGTSHSSQTTDGMRGLLQYKSGDETLFDVTFDGNPIAGKLDIHYRRASGTDLSHDSLDANGHTGYYTGTVQYLDSHPEINVVMWSWCSIEGHNVQIYLDNFQELIDMYKAGGSKGRTSANEVTFVFMTGYARGNDSDTPESPYIRSPYQNHKRITDYCKAYGYFCLDYWSQDVYEYETDAYKPTENANSNVQHKAYFDSHQEGEHWFATRNYSSGAVKWPAHCEGLPQHITSNRRAYGAWWIWARLAGWDGQTSPQSTVAVTSPNGGQVWTAGSQQEITWTSEGTLGNVSLDYSTDNGTTWIPITSSTANDGAYSWTVPDSASSQCFLRVSETDGTPTDISDAFFSIVSLADLSVAVPNGGEQWVVGSSQTISWNSGGTVGLIKIEYSTSNGADWLPIAASTLNDGVFSWTVPDSASDQCLVRISESDGNLVDVSDAAFSIVTNPTLTVTAPNGGEDWTVGSSQTITWNSGGTVGNVSLAYSVNNGSSWTTITSSTSNDGSFTWSVADAVSSQCLIRVSESDGNPLDVSNSVFSIVA